MWIPGQGTSAIYDKVEAQWNVNQEPWLPDQSRTLDKVEAQWNVNIRNYVTAFRTDEDKVEAQWNVNDIKEKDRRREGLG